MRVIHWAGDSTCAPNKYLTYPQTGIAQAFDRYAKNDVLVYDHAVNGRSTKSFLAEGRLETIDQELREGDFLFIQFGHNDEKKNDPARYTDPDGAFIGNLKKMIDVARAHGAHPLLITPVERRHFDGAGQLEESGHAPYAAAAVEAGRRFDVPVADLWRLSRELLQKLGPAASEKYYMVTKPGEFRKAPQGQVDNSHLKYEGAMVFAGLVAEELRRIGGIYGDLLEEGEALQETTSIEIGG